MIEDLRPDPTSQPTPVSGGDLPLGRAQFEVSPEAERLAQEIRETSLRRLDSSFPFYAYNLLRGDRRSEPREEWIRDSAVQFARDISEVITNAAPSKLTYEGRLTPVVTHLPLDAQHPRSRSYSEQERGYSHFLILRNDRNECLLPFRDSNGKWRWQELPDGDAGLDCSIRCSLSRESADKRNFNLLHFVDRTGFLELLERLEIHFQRDLATLRDSNSSQGSLLLNQVLQSVAAFYQLPPQQLLHAVSLELEPIEASESDMLHAFLVFQLDPWQEPTRCFVSITHRNHPRDLSSQPVGTFTVRVREPVNKFWG